MPGPVAEARREVQSVVQVAVLAGGPSSEHDVSLDTGREILGLLQDGGHRARPVLIDHEERWALGAVGASFDRLGEFVTREVALRSLAEGGDVAYIGLHGPFGEDGTVQRLLGDAGIPYSGSGPIASALGMDKELSKIAAAKCGAFTASHEVLSGSELPVNGIARAIGYPCFVKPLTAGSSVGVARVEDEAGLRAAVPRAQAEDVAGRCLVEQSVEGPEVTCSILRHEGRLVSFPLVAVAPAHGFYDYHAKYKADDTAFSCPAPVSEAVREEIETVSRALFQNLELRGVVRLDFIVSLESGRPVFLELNTLPGFTDHSLVPRAALAAGWEPLHVIEAVLRDTGDGG